MKGTGWCQRPVLCIKAVYNTSSILVLPHLFPGIPPDCKRGGLFSEFVECSWWFGPKG